MEYKEEEIDEMIYEFLGDYGDKRRGKELRSKINVEKINQFI